jgi:hypothetical protein
MTSNRNFKAPRFGKLAARQTHRPNSEQICIQLRRADYETCELLIYLHGCVHSSLSTPTSGCPLISFGDTQK